MAPQPPVILQNVKPGQKKAGNHQSGSFNDNSAFAPSSNLTHFLMNKGSSGSLKALENEYAYKINYDSQGSSKPGIRG